MKKRILLAILGLAFALGGLTGCTITPGLNVGVSLDYYGGSFHVRPNASVGVYGRP